MNRKQFLRSSLLTSAGTLLMPSFLFSQQKTTAANVVIQSVELLQWKNNYFVFVKDVDGNKGVTLCNARMEYLAGIFNGLVAPFFIGKSAAQIAQLVEDVYKEERNYKFSGMPFWNCVGHIEVAVWDLLGKVANKPVYELLGKQLRKELPMYLSSLTRNNTATEEVNKILPALEETGCKAVKIKVGSRMGNDEKAEQRSYEIIKLLRSKAPSSLTIYADANGSFNIKQGIAMGKFLEEYAIDIFEEPCPWEDFESNKKVNSALKKIKIAGGEQDTSFHRFEWYCKNNGLDILQPDTFYNGGISRTLKVATLCQQYNKHFAPHSPKADPLEAAFLHLMAVAPNVYGYQEFPLNAIEKKQENWWEAHFKLENGVLNVPEKAGLGILYDEIIFKEAFVVKK